jgi:hypothetical protein
MPRWRAARDKSTGRGEEGSLRSARVRVALFLLVVGSGGCSRGSAKPLASAGLEAAAASPSSAAPSASTPPIPPQISPAEFSAPIAASRANHRTVVAGLIAAEGVIRVMGLATGEPAWKVDALHGVAWAADAELRLMPAADGVALLWRGIFGGKTTATLVVLGPHGEPRGDAIAVGAGSCTTADGVAWVDPRGVGPVHARTRRWGELAARDVVTLSPDRAPTLLCAEHDAFVLGEGDDDLAATAFSPADGVARPVVVAIRDRDFGDDEEREHEAFTVGDDLGIVRVGGTGTLSVREISRGRASSWRRLKHALSEDDDVVAVDGDGPSMIVVFAREAADPCPEGGPSAQTVRALTIDRKTGNEALVSLAPANCDSTSGPFWIGAAQGAPVVAWSRRRARPAPGAAPIDGLAYRAFEDDRSREGRLDVEADALVDAGCDDTGCFVAALVRAPGSDGGRPEPILALTYPQ